MTTTIYSDLWYKVIAQPRYDKRVAKALRLAHNHLLQRKAKSNVAGEFGIDVAKLEYGKATQMRVSSPAVDYSWEHADYENGREYP